MPCRLHRLLKGNDRALLMAQTSHVPLLGDTAASPRTSARDSPASTPSSRPQALSKQLAQLPRKRKRSSALGSYEWLPAKVGCGSFHGNGEMSTMLPVMAEA